jgi:hypothetical protein
MKILAPFSLKYYRPQYMFLRRNLCSTRDKDHPLRRLVYRSIDPRGI